MTDSYKLLGKVAAEADKEKSLYISPSDKQAIVSHIDITNFSEEDATFNIHVHQEPLTQEDMLPMEGTNFYLVSANLETAVSTDGTNWTSLISDYTAYDPDEYDWSAWGGRFPNYVRALGYIWAINADASPSQIARTEDGTSWEIIDPQNSWSSSNRWPYNWIFVNNDFLLADDELWESTDGINYSIIPSSSYISLSDTLSMTFGINYENNKYIVLYKNTSNIFKVSVSTDQISWSQYTVPLSYPWGYRKVVYGNGMYVLCAEDSSFTSTDLITWTMATALISGNNYTSWYYNAKYFKNKWIINTENSGSPQTLFTSTDFITWIPQTILRPDGSSLAPKPYSFQESSNLLMINDDQGYVITTTNAVTWTTSLTPVNNWGWGDRGWWPGLLFEGTSDYKSSKETSVFYESVIKAGKVENLSTGIVMAPNNSIIVKSNSDSVGFSGYGVEI